MVSIKHALNGLLIGYVRFKRTSARLNIVKDLRDFPHINCRRFLNYLLTKYYQKLISFCD